MLIHRYTSTQNLFQVPFRITGEGGPLINTTSSFNFMLHKNAVILMLNQKLSLYGTSV